MALRSETATDDNPILASRGPIRFDAIRARHVVPGLRAALATTEEVYDRVRRASPPYRWDDLLGAIDRAETALDRIIHTVSHLNNVRQDADFRAAWSEILPELQSAEARRRSDPQIYRRLLAYEGGHEGKALPSERARFLEVTLAEMRRSGAGLDGAARVRATELRSQLAELANRFQNNVLDGTNAFTLDVRDEARLAGVPSSARKRARALAEAAGVEGWRFTLHPPSYLAIVDHAEDRELRREMHLAQQDRGRGEGRDNRELIPRILELRSELATLLGYANWADLQTELRMARSGSRAQEFEHDLWNRVEPHYRSEADEIQTFARSQLGLDPLEAWDVRFAIEQLRQARFDLDDEMLRPYFPLDRVQAGLFGLAHDLFGVTIQPGDPEGRWHPDVEVFDVVNDAGVQVGTFYTDWHPREDKRGGAWMSSLSQGGPVAAGFEPHLGAISGNLTPPDGDGPALLTHDETRTIFHEFGHLIHHLLTTVEVRSLGANSAAWDFIEVPSQILENWLWEDDALVRIARHVDDDTPLPDELRSRMHAARTFGAAHHMARQLSFGTVDLALHVDFEPERHGDPIAFGREVLGPFQIRADHVSDGFLPAFSHIFAGGYAAGYYAYLWSEMLEADAFARFRAEGIFSREVGEALRRTILSRGNAERPEAMMRAFLGRDPDPEALLVRNLGLERDER